MYQSHCFPVSLCTSPVVSRPLHNGAGQLWDTEGRPLSLGVAVPHTHTHTHIHTHTHARTNICTHARAYTHSHTHIHTHTNTHTHTHSLTHTYTRAHTHTPTEFHTLSSNFRPTLPYIKKGRPEGDAWNMTLCPSAFRSLTWMVSHSQTRPSINIRQHPP